MREAIGEAWIEDDLEPLHRIGDAIAHFMADGRMHPAVGGENPKSRSCSADSDRNGGENMQPARHPVAAEQQDAEESRFQEKRGQNFVADQRADGVAGDEGKAAPVGAELIGQHDAGHHAHGERHGEDARPEAGDVAINVAPGAAP
jgi:hypothetical protein